MNVNAFRVHSVCQVAHEYTGESTENTMSLRLTDKVYVIDDNGHEGSDGWTLALVPNEVGVPSIGFVPVSHLRMLRPESRTYGELKRVSPPPPAKRAKPPPPQRRPETGKTPQSTAAQTEPTPVKSEPEAQAQQQQQTEGKAEVTVKTPVTTVETAVETTVETTVETPAETPAEAKDETVADTEEAIAETGVQAEETEMKEDEQDEATLDEANTAPVEQQEEPQKEQQQDDSEVLKEQEETATMSTEDIRVLAGSCVRELLEDRVEPLPSPVSYDTASRRKRSSARACEPVVPEDIDVVSAFSPHFRHALENLGNSAEMALVAAKYFERTAKIFDRAGQELQRVAKSIEEPPSDVSTSVRNAFKAVRAVDLKQGQQLVSYAAFIREVVVSELTNDREKLMSVHDGIKNVVASAEAASKLAVSHLQNADTSARKRASTRDSLKHAFEAIRQQDGDGGDLDQTAYASSSSDTGGGVLKSAASLTKSVPKFRRDHTTEVLKARDRLVQASEAAAEAARERIAAVDGVENTNAQLDITLVRCIEQYGVTELAHRENFASILENAVSRSHDIADLHRSQLQSCISVVDQIDPIADLRALCEPHQNSLQRDVSREPAQIVKTFVNPSERTLRARLPPCADGLEPALCAIDVPVQEEVGALETETLQFVKFNKVRRALRRTVCVRMAGDAPVLELPDATGKSRTVAVSDVKSAGTQGRSVELDFFNRDKIKMTFNSSQDAQQLAGCLDLLRQRAAQTAGAKTADKITCYTGTFNLGGCLPPALAAKELTKARKKEQKLQDKLTRLGLAALSDDDDDDEDGEEGESTTTNTADKKKSKVAKARARVEELEVQANQQTFAFVDSSCDIIVVGVQEAPRDRGTRKAWLAHITEHVGPGHDLLAHESMWQIAVYVFVRKSLAIDVNSLEARQVACGIGNTIGNKGAVAVSFNIQGTSFVFVCLHLAARAERLLVRRDNYRRIVTQLRGMGEDEDLDFLHSFDHVVILGDLNYRTQSFSFHDSIDIVAKGEMDRLAATDQLRSEMAEEAAFGGFAEGEIASFAPTYRMSKTMHYRTRDEANGLPATFSNKRQQLPSWTDRVLFRSRSSVIARDFQLEAYQAHHDVLGSDHRPVSARFAVRFRPRLFVPPSCSTRVLALADLFLRPDASALSGEASSRSNSVSSPMLSVDSLLDTTTSSNDPPTPTNSSKPRRSMLRGALRMSRRSANSDKNDPSANAGAGGTDDKDDDETATEVL
ncbi:MAG: hypothetical protein MHM6MM_004370 [Cercozoa sp. M6MM]